MVMSYGRRWHEQPAKMCKTCRSYNPGRYVNLSKLKREWFCNACADKLEQQHARP